MSITPEAFIKKYSDTKLNERGGAQLHFIDLCDLLDIPRPDGSETYRFEQPVLKVAGGKGFADVFYEGKFGWEYKGKGADLKKAYQQLLSYREDLENPPLLIVSDMQNIELHTNFTGTQKQVIRWELNDLKDSERRKQLRQVWTEPQAFNPSHRIEEATVAAVAALGKISNALKDRQENPEMVAHFLVRTMFTLFAEDVELIPADTFKRLLEAAKKHPEDFKEMCEELFAAMKVGKKTVVGRIPYINGGVFDDTSAPALNAEEVNELYYAARRNWKQVDPTIFGTLFETVIDPGKRWQLGAHYTPLVDILDVVGPVIMRPLREEWEALRERLKPLMADIEQARAQHSGGLYVEGGLGQTQQDEAVSLLTAFQDRLATVKVLDPAMGSGNFLYVTMRLLLDLEAEVRETIRTVTQNVPPPPKVNPRQMLGMEVNPYAHEIAGMVLWIGYLQWMREHHEPFKVSPVLDKLPGLVNKDAVLDNGDEAKWPDAEFIVGNPPFLGNQKLSKALGEEYLKSLRRAYAGRLSDRTDFVCYWFEKARSQIVAGKTKRAGLIATSNIKSGINIEVLKKISETATIFMAWPDREWIQDGANVRVSIVGFSAIASSQPVIYRFSSDRKILEQAVPVIHPNLNSGSDITRAISLKENMGKAYQGVTPAGPFDVVGSEAREWLELPNPTGVSNSEVLRPYITGDEIMGHVRDRWIVDFNAMSLEEAEKYRRPIQHVRDNVFPVRQNNNRKGLRERWWLAGESQQAMRRAISGMDKILVTSRVSVYRIFTWFDTRNLPSNKLAVIALDDWASFGVLNSSSHTVWAAALGGRHGAAGDLVYSHSLIFETFPFPICEGIQRESIEVAAKYLQNSRDFLAKKDKPGRSSGHKLGLTDMYNLLVEYRASKQEKVAGLAGLADAHDMLDKAVAAAYGWSWPMDEDELLGRLLELNLERAAAEKDTVRGKQEAEE